ncbi:hypothetical protein ACHAWF_006013 [Thalassiosira exigua]
MMVCHDLWASCIFPSGLESDSDGEGGGGGDAEAGEEAQQEKPRYVPPRSMELLDLGLHGPTDGADEGAGKEEGAGEVTYHMTRLPNLLGINPIPYDPRTHDAEDEEERYKGCVHNMIRWRHKRMGWGPNASIARDDDGKPIMESNARLVKWSDGSYTLHVGGEVLEVDDHDSSLPKDHPDPSLAGFAGINGYLYVSQKARVRPPSKKALEADGPLATDEDDGDAEEARPAGTVLECVGPVASRLALRPSSLASDAHRSLKLAVQKRNVRRARIAEVVTEVDPEREKRERIRGKEDLAKSRARAGGGRRSGGGGRRRGRMNESYLEEEEDEDAGDYDGVNLGRLKRRTMRRRYDEDDDAEEEEMDDYGEDSEKEEDWGASSTSRAKRKRGALAKARAAKERSASRTARDEDDRGDDDDSSEEGEVVFGDDDDEEEDAAFGKKRGGAKKQAILDDDDDED